MDINSKNGLLFLIQIDHLNGECIGDVISRFYKAGASNVQIIPSITKKNRPSYVALIDTKEENQNRIEECIFSEFSSGGWHILHTTHRYLYSSFMEKQVHVQKEEKHLLYTIRAKRFDKGGFRIEHDDLAGLRKKIEEQFGILIPYLQLYNFLVSAMENENTAQLCL